MAIVRLDGSDVVANAIILLNQACGRRTLTVREYHMFWENLKNNSKGIEVARNWYADDILRVYFDIVDLNSKGIVYRLKPYYKIDDLRDKFHGYLSLELYLLLCDKSLITGLNDLSKEEEDMMPEFKKLDEKYQLELMYDLYSFEKKRRMIEARLNKVRNNSSSLVSDITVEEIFEHKPNVSQDGLIELYQTSKGR